MLCNSTVQDPVACPEGHLYCRACVLESLLAQKKLIRQHLEQVDTRQQQEEQDKVRVKQEARERVLRDFERTQSALAGGSSATRPQPAGQSADSAKISTADKEAEDGQSSIAHLAADGLIGKLTNLCLSLLPGRGVKRKFGFDLDAVSKLAEEAEEAAMIKIEKEQAESRKAKLPAFWL